ncbi:hypothetical protein Cpir12675_000920 [Ceratocystis pirilliformis]|uniref:G domain-containing protein n=1 Tax=Ceratocystis pirilliformis TaxID=259994 RepID=A0ABR3ZJU2_9PEZI
MASEAAIGPSKENSGKASREVEVPSLWDSPSIVFDAASENPRFHSHEMTKAIDFFQAVTTPKAVFQYSANTFYDHRINDYVPEVCVLGCSNAGKSTFVNALLGAPLARSSSTPGYTKLMNVFGCGSFVPRAEVARWAAAYAAARRAQKSSKPIPRLGAPRSLVLVDSPGYGFRSRGEWGAHIDKYLHQRKSLRGIVLLIRAELPLTQADAYILEMLADVSHKRKRAAAAAAASTDSSSGAAKNSIQPVGVTIVLTRADRCEEQQRGKSWLSVCAERVREIRECLTQLGTQRTGGWVPQIYVSAAGMSGSVATARDEKIRVRRVGEHAGMGGARVAVLKMAGIIAPDAVPQHAEEEVNQWERLEEAIAKRESTTGRQARGNKAERFQPRSEYKVQREVKKQEARRSRENEKKEMKREAKLGKNMSRTPTQISSPPLEFAERSLPATKDKTRTSDDDKISPRNRALEEGESGHIGYDGQIVSFDDLFTNKD